MNINKNQRKYSYYRAFSGSAAAVPFFYLPKAGEGLGIHGEFLVFLKMLGY